MQDLAIPLLPEGQACGEVRDQTGHENENSRSAAQRLVRENLKEERCPANMSAGTCHIVSWYERRRRSRNSRRVAGSSGCFRDTKVCTAFCTDLT
jgi:hypothetical protein